MEAEPVTEPDGRMDDVAWLAAALIVIRDVDPKLYREIRANPWQVHVVADLAELAAATHDREYGVLGTTLHRDTFVPRAQVERYARKMGVPAADMLAAVLVHEWDHAEHDGDEADAHEAAFDFMCKLYAAALERIADALESNAGGTAAPDPAPTTPPGITRN
jgi:hypothetical protein